jgi:hypothetical protein
MKDRRKYMLTIGNDLKSICKRIYISKEKGIIGTKDKEFFNKMTEEIGKTTNISTI